VFFLPSHIKPRFAAEVNTRSKILSKDKLDISAISPGDLATLLSQSLRRPVTEEQIRDIADAGKLLSENTINLIEYTAYLAQEVNFGNTN